MNFRKVISGLLLVTTLLGSVSISFGENDIKVVVDGKELNMDVPPIIINGRVLCPLRAIFESVGAIVTWEASTRKVTGTKGNTVVELTLDSKEVIVNGVKSEIDVPATIYSGKTFVPIRFISENIGANVNWDKYSNTAYILTNHVELQDTKLNKFINGQEGNYFNGGKVVYSEHFTYAVGRENSGDYDSKYILKIDNETGQCIKKIKICGEGSESIEGLQLDNNQLLFYKRNIIYGNGNYSDTTTINTFGKIDLNSLNKEEIFTWNIKGEIKSFIIYDSNIYFSTIGKDENKKSILNIYSIDMNGNNKINLTKQDCEEYTSTSIYIFNNMIYYNCNSDFYRYDISQNKTEKIFDKLGRHYNIVNNFLYQLDYDGIYRVNLLNLNEKICLYKKANVKDAFSPNYINVHKGIIYFITNGYRYVNSISINGGDVNSQLVTEKFIDTLFITNNNIFYKVHLGSGSEYRMLWLDNRKVEQSLDTMQGGISETFATNPKATPTATPKVIEEKSLILTEAEYQKIARPKIQYLITYVDTITMINNKIRTNQTLESSYFTKLIEHLENMNNSSKVGETPEKYILVEKNLDLVVLDYKLILNKLQQVQIAKGESRFEDAIKFMKEVSDLVDDSGQRMNYVEKYFPESFK